MANAQKDFQKQQNKQDTIDPKKEVEENVVLHTPAGEMPNVDRTQKTGQGMNPDQKMEMGKEQQQKKAA